MNQHFALGIEKEDFLRNISEQDMRVFRQAVPSTLLNWEDVNRALFCVEPTSPSVRMFKEGLVPEALYVEDYQLAGQPGKRLKKAALYELMREGATMVLNRLDSRFEVVKQLCAEVAAFTSSEAIANGYIAFSGRGSFGSHWDTHDVMAVQLIGRKHWKVYRPTFALPIPGQTSKSLKHQCPAEPVFDGVLEAGDMLYLPRGWWHNALPIGETFHIAIGIHTATVLNYLSWLCTHVLQSDVELRHSVRPGKENSAAVSPAIEAIARAVADPGHLSRFLEALQSTARSAYSPFAIEMSRRAIEGGSNADGSAAVGAQRDGMILQHGHA